MAAVVVEERLAVLRFEPGFAAPVLQRLRNGRELLITNQKQVDGVTFYAVKLPPEKSGWVQADAVVSSARAGDDARLARLIQASDGFDKIERAALFLENFPRSIFRPAILLLLGDLIEESAQKLSRDAKRHFESEETRASGAPLYSFYLSYNGLDRYRRLGVNFALDRAANQFHYDGASWREIIEKHPHAAEAVEARKRLTTLNLAIK